MSIKTLSHQHSLPSLPLPSLNNTCERYLKSVQPFLNEEEYYHTKSEVERFQNGVGKILHQKLYQKMKSNRNWLQFWWDNSYLDYRGPLPFCSNTAGTLESQEWDQPKLGSQLERGALWIHFAAVDHVERIRQLLPVGKFGNNSYACMLQYYKYCVGRIPGEKKDIPICHVHVIPKQDGSCEVVCEVRHFIVLMKGRIFKLQVLDENKKPYTPAEIHYQLLLIADMCKKSGEGLSIGSLTSADRNTWFKAYTNLCELDIQNRTNISIINEAIWVIAFDDVETYTLQQAFENCALGDCVNRWFDKNVCIVTATGHFGNNNDHLFIDGYVGIHTYQRIHDKCLKQMFQWNDGNVRSDLVLPCELLFVVDDHILLLIQESQVKHRNLMASFLAIDRPIRGFGKVLCKSLRINPDHLVQIAIQLGYYRLHKKCVATYESASTRQFYNGRTSTVRSCTNETKAFTESMLDPSISKENRKQLLIKATECYSILMKDAMAGQDIDRHFFGMRKIVELEGMALPSLFKDKAWKLSGGDCNYILSTSLSGYFHFHGGLAPMVFDGYGVFYTISDECINIVVTAWKDSMETRCDEFYNAIVLSCQDVKDLLSDCSKL